MEATLRALYEHLGMDASKLPYDSGSGRYERKKFCCVLPGHTDRTPSATVRYEPGWYNCFGCGDGNGTNSVGLIMAVVGCDVADAYRWAEQNVTGYVNARGALAPKPKERYRPSWADDKPKPYRISWPDD
jgi:CHC2 zinc finger